MFKRPDITLSTFSWLIFGFLGIVLSFSAMYALKPTPIIPVQVIQAISVGIIGLFISNHLLNLVTGKPVQE